MLKILVLLFLLGSNNLVGEPLDSIITYNDHFEVALGHYESERYKLAELEFKKYSKKIILGSVTHLMVAKSQY